MIPWWTLISAVLLGALAGLLVTALCVAAADGRLDRER